MDMAIRCMQGTSRAFLPPVFAAIFLGQIGISHADEETLAQRKKTRLWTGYANQRALRQP